MIRVEQLTKVYGATKAVENLDFTVERGEIVGFLGPNGAGKSTTMRMLCGSLGATSGRALVADIDVLERPREVKQIVGYLPEVPPLYPEMTVRSYLRFCARLKGAPSPIEGVERVMERVGLASVSHRLIEHLSKGFRQRVGLAQALVHEPRVLVLDEPASGLDPAQRVEIRHLVKELSQGDVTVVLSTHVLSEVEAICDRVVIIDQGRIVAEDTMENLAGAGTAIRVRVARPSEGVSAAVQQVEAVTAVQSLEEGVYRISASSDVREEIAAAVVEFGLLELTGQRALEDVFLKLTGEGR